ncbi:MAG: DUF115 domain-containing protein [Magnetococcales bacterium]|nr:DUF115 domain-containing protein [Magnetococcales bacterium]
MSDLMQTESLGPLLMNRFEECYLPGVNQEAFSRVGSENVFQQQYGPLFLKEDSLFLVLGCDSGLLLQWILKRQRPEGSRFLFIELPDVLERLRQEGLLPDELPDQCHITTLDQWLAVAETCAIRDYFYLDQVYLVKSLAVIDGVHGGYAQLVHQLERDLGQYRLMIENEIGNRLFTVRGLENVAENRFQAKNLTGIFAGKTAVLLAGGPSLSESFPWIRRHREQLVVLAVSRVADQLREAGVVADLFFAIDPKDVIFHQSKGILSSWQESVLVNMYHLNSALLSQWQGRSAYMGQLLPWESPLNLPNVNYPGITVSHQALGMAVDMGFACVVLSGFDLCFSREGFTHAQGSVEQQIGPYITRSDLLVETNGGWMAETRHDFLNAIPSLALLAKYAAEKQCRVVNPSQASARVDGVEYCSWDEIVPTPLEQSARARLLQVLPVETTQERLAHYRAVDQELRALRALVVKVKELAVEGIACNDGLFGRRGKPPNYQFKKRMDEIEQTLDERYREVSRLVKKWGLAAMLKLSRPNKEREWSDAEIERTGRMYYEIYRDNATSLIRQLEQVRLRVAARMEEEKPRPNFKTLIAQWQRDGQPGRGRLFLQRRGWRIEELPERVQRGFLDLEQAFAELVALDDNNYKQMLLAKQSSPREVRARAQALFVRRERERLYQFGVGLDKSSLAEKSEYACLIQGYLAELDGDPVCAKEHYRQLTHELLVSEGLHRQLVIALQLQELSEAVEMARRLTELSMAHVPVYADLLRLCGDRERSAAIFEEYLKLVRKDFVNLMKLGRIYQELGRIEQAREIFEGILQEDPENLAVRSMLAGL